MDEAAKKQNDLQRPVPSVGTANKEAGVSAPYIESAEPELKLPEEVEKAGVRVSEPAVPEHGDAGITPHGENIKPNIASPKAEFAMSEAEADGELKNVKKEFNLDLREQREGMYGGIPSIFFLAALIKKHFKRIHQKLIGQTA